MASIVGRAPPLALVSPRRFLPVEPPLLGGFRGLGSAACLGHCERPTHDTGKALERVLAVPQLAAVVGRHDAEVAVAIDAAGKAQQQAGSLRLAEHRRRRDIPHRLDAGGTAVHVLATRSAGGWPG